MKLASRRISVSSTILLLMLMILTSFSLYVMVVCAFKPNADIIAPPIDLNPFGNLTLKNIINVLTESDIFTWLYNSVLISISVAALTAFVGVAAGYALARINFRMKHLFFVLVMATMMMPKQVLMIPNFLVASKLGLLNSLVGVVLTSLSPAFSVFLCRQSIASLPRELFESAEIDGCGELGKFFRIALPLSLPSVGTAAIFSFFGTFNDYVWQLIMLTDKKLMTLPIGVAFFTSAQVNNRAMQLACAFIVSIPLVLLFIAGQKMFIKGATVGALKG